MKSTLNVTANQKAIGYAELFTVVLIWGLYPVVLLYAYDYFSAAIFSFCTALVSCSCLLFLCRKKLRFLNGACLKVAIPTGLFYALAGILQKIGLNYTTPTRYAFLENLCCVAVPIFSFIFVRKKPCFITVAACVVCLASSFVLCGVSSDGIGFGIGEVLCALAGIFYGVNIAATGAFAKDCDTSLYLLVQHGVTAILSLITAVTLNFVTINGTPLEPLKFSFGIKPIVFTICFALITQTLCWFLRTASLKRLEASAVAVISNFAAVVTSVVSVISGKDALTKNLVWGVILGVISIILSSVGDNVDAKKQLKRQLSSNAETPSEK